MPVAIYSIPRSTRGGPPKTLGGGPGAYDAVKPYKHNPQNAKIGTEPRGKTDIKDVPGPGNYYAPVKNKKAAPEYSMGAKFRAAQQQDNPAPGNYDPTTYNQKSAPSFSMRPKTALPKDTSAKPGPNNYNPNFEFAREHPTSGKNLFGFYSNSGQELQYDSYTN